MKLAIVLLGATFAFPALGAKPDEVPEGQRSGSVVRPAVGGPGPEAVRPEDRRRQPRRQVRDGEPPEGDTRPGGPSAAVKDPHVPESERPTRKPALDRD